MIAKNQLIEEYMHMPYRFCLVRNPDGSGFTASYPELSGCEASAETAEGAIKKSAQALRDWFEASIEDGKEIPVLKTNIFKFEKA